MRSTTLETFDGKDIVVPNEKFISSSFTNWTHKNTKQRNRVGGDLLLIILETLQNNGIEIPFPQRDIRVVSTGDGEEFAKKP